MLNPRVTPGASLTPIDGGWRFQIPAGPAGSYRLAQLDDYSSLSRSRFPLNAPAGFSLRCRVSPPFHPPIFAQSNSASEENEVGRKWGKRGGLPGTWGFGFWNDPFAVSLGLGGASRRLPCLPNAAWFFYGSSENYLSLREDKPASGLLAASLSSPKIPSLLIAAGLPAAALLFSKALARRLRWAASQIVREDSLRLGMDPADWHEYRLGWSAQRVEFFVDGKSVFETGISPHGPLGLVIWIDNQFAAFTPAGKISAGTLENPAPAWMEITDLKLA